MAKKRGRPKKTVVAVKDEKGRFKDIVPAKVPLKQITEQTMAALVLKGDLSGMYPSQKMEYYYRLCEHLHLDPVTRPFDIINIRGREILYAHKGCTDQLRKMNGVSVTDIKGEQIADVYRVTAIGHDKTGRTDAATGVVSIGKLAGDDLANALMKAETKAKRRLTLSLCGLGMLDETEIETIPGAINVEFAELNGKAQNPALPTEKKWTPEVETPISLVDPKAELEHAHGKLLALYKQMVALKVHTPEELEERKEQAVKAKGNLNSLVDLYNAWSMECKERQRK